MALQGAWMFVKSRFQTLNHTRWPMGGRSGCLHVRMAALLTKFSFLI
jgi:hypothetical protein